ncbi:hypothetical protein [Streptomyces sp. NBC_00525]|uniref:hypothetical protein n=1 Tax=Streptomyces sp. NBC_00525 TaxID=2903660 RepID=UPI002E81DEF7|nr:hypothetical protein [Streptomyces sp. NBC_00525]WUC94425.1 hypothetical protein OG710_12880 [Streptomyces sp. NBC_00525]
MADEDGAQQRHASQGPEAEPVDNKSHGPEEVGPSNDRSTDPVKDSGDEEKKKRDPNYWAAGSFLLNLWRILRDWLNSEQPPSFGPPFL